MSFKRMSQSVQDLPPATRASEHQVLPPFPRPTGQHVDTKITKFQEDSDFVLQKAISVQWVGESRSRQRLKGNYREKGTLKKTFNFTLSRMAWPHGRTRVQKTGNNCDTIFWEFAYSPRKLCLKANFIYLFISLFIWLAPWRIEFMGQGSVLDSLTHYGRQGTNLRSGAPEASLILLCHSENP